MKIIASIGLILDIIGVAIAYLDIRLEFLWFQRHRRLQRLRENSDHLEHGAQDDLQSPGAERAVDELATLLTAAQDSYSRLPFRVPVTREVLKRIAAELNLETDPHVVTSAAPGPFDRTAFNAALLTLEGELARRMESELTNRWRPNLRLGFRLLILGFIFQLCAVWLP